MTLEKAIEKLNQLERAAYALKHAQDILYVDGDTVAPRQSWKARGEALGYLSELEYQLMVSPETGDVLSEITSRPGEVDEITLRRAEVLKEAYDDMHVLSQEEYTAYAQLTNEASAVWHEAKVRSDFASFAPYLERIIAARRRYAALRNPELPAYDVLLNLYEKGACMADLDPFFRTLREELSPLIAEVAAHPLPTPGFMKKTYPIAQQRDFSDRLMLLQGIDPERCSIGETEHPFTGGPNKWDVRITTHYHEEDVTLSLFSVIHEGGHALYELGIRDDLALTCLGGGSTMGIHESQSRFYENILGRSRAYCTPLLKILKESFPAQMEGVTEEELYRGINLSHPSLIRTEADELTYPLHVMIRYELEKALVAGDLSVQELPGAWNEAYRKYLGIEVPDDRRGVLQDSHWSTGYLGYFPSYALGSAYGVQMLHQMQASFDVWATVAQGNLKPITDWLGQKIHQYGKLKLPRDLLLNAMGGPLDAREYTGYLQKKYRELYQL